MIAHAVVFEDARRTVFRRIDIPDPGPRDVVLRTRYSLISNGTESSFLRGERVDGETPARPGDRLPFPQVAGYQKVGIIEKAPPDSGLSAGQWAFCTISKVGLPGQPLGGHVSIAVADTSQVYALPPGLDPVEASGLVLTQVGYNCGFRPPVAAGDHAVVLGDGMVGHWTAQSLQHRGASVVLVGRHRYRCEMFRPGPNDAIICLDPGKKIAEEVRAVRPSGTAILVDTVGDSTAVNELLPLLGHNSHLVSAGFLGHEGRIDIQRLRMRETTLHCPSGWARDRMEATLELVASGVLRVSPLITHRLPAKDAPEAFRLILEKAHPFLGILLDWDRP